MWIPVIRSDAGLLVSAALAVATASPALAADKYVLGLCQVARPDSGAEIWPSSDGNSYLYEYQRTYALREKFDFRSSDTKITLLKKPTHGTVRLDESEIALESGWYHYWPNDGYVGRDRFAMQVEKDGVKVRIEYVMEVVPYGEHTTYRDENDVTHGLFCNPDSWKISQSDVIHRFDHGARG